MYDDITYTVDDGIATLTIQRPEVHNAFTGRTITELNEALTSFQDDAGAHVCILTGSNNGFCAGADVGIMPDWPSKGKEAYGEFLGEIQDVVSNLRETPKPTVAAVNGPAIGAGCDFALACDVRFVGPDAVLTEGFVRVGLVPGDGGAWLLPRLIGEAKAREYLLTGRDIDASTAVELGLAVEVVDDAVDGARAFAEEILELPSMAVRRTNELVDPDQSFETYCERAIDFQWECVNDPEHAEAVAAFRENREPSYERDYN